MCANAGVFVWLQFYMQVLARRGIYGLELWGRVGGTVAPLLTAIAFAGALAGQGKARLPLALSAVFGILIWIPPVVF